MIKPLLKILLVFTMIFFSNHVVGHPVIWKNGIVTNYSYDAMSASTIAHYSVTHRWSVGARSQSFHDTGEHAIIGQNNWLLKRWNGHHSQGNLYILSGVGHTTNQPDDQALLHMGSQADWETRRLYTYSSVNYFHQDDDDRLLFRGRLGIAPYEARFNQIHTWLMVQVDHMTHNGQITQVAMPVVRLFKHNVLIEVGSDFSGNALVTAMIHF